MPSGMPNKEKARMRQLFAEGKVGRDALLESEAQSYHCAGTCTFYGTANSNQMMMEVMGLHLPGAAFVPPNTPLRDALTSAAARRAAAITALGNEYLPIARIVDERAIVNAIVGLLATGGSTNHTMHLVAMARAAGMRVNWDDFSELSEIVPLLARIYPNGRADVNHFHAAGGMGFLIRELLGSGLLHADTTTVMGRGLEAYTRRAVAVGRTVLAWRAAPQNSGDPDVLRPMRDPFGADGGLKVLRGNLGRAVIKTSAVQPQHRVVEAPAAVFDDQEAVIAAFKAGALTRDCVVVVRYPGSARQRHAGAASADAGAQLAAEQGSQGRARHRRPHVGCVGRSARRDSRHARMPRRRTAEQGPRRRHHAARQLCRHARSARVGGDDARPLRAAAEPRAQHARRRPRIVRDVPQRRQRRRNRCRFFVWRGIVNIRSLLALAPVIPVLTIEKVDHAVPLGRALCAGGLRVLEVTLRTTAGLPAIEAMRKAVPEAVVGVGTLTRPRRFRRAAMPVRNSA